MNFYRITKAGINLFWLSLGIVIFLSSFDNRLVLNEKMLHQVRLFFPEGWGFFTKNPKESLMDVYLIKNENKQILESWDLSNNSRQNLLGLSREARIKGYEMSIILDSFNKSWKEDTSHDIYSHVKDEAFHIKSPKDFKYFNKGSFLIVMRKPIPWLWIGKDQGKYAPFKTLKISIDESKI